MSVGQLYYVCSDGDEHKGWMDGCMVWWRAEGHGYTYDLNFAGLFTEADRESDYPPRTAHYVPRELVDANSYSPRLAYWSRPRDTSRAICEVLRTPAPLVPSGRIADAEQAGREAYEEATKEGYHCLRAACQALGRHTAECRREHEESTKEDGE